MSEINREIPEGQISQATIINFEAAKAKRIEEKTRQSHWIQERAQNQPLTRIDATTPAPSPVTTEVYQSAQSGRRVEFTGEEGDTRENRPPNENTYMVIDIQKARVNRLLKEQSNLGVFPESNTFTASFLKPRLIDAGENVVNDSDDNARNQEKKQEESRNEPETNTPDKEQIIAMGVFCSKLAQFDVPMQKRDEIFENLADDPKAIIKVAGVVKNFHPQNSIEILENIAAFRKRIDQAIENKAAQANEETVRELSGFELLILILGSLLKGSADAVAGDELEQIGLKEKEAKNG